MFIVFEGLDGTGKTTQSKRLVKLLKRQGYDALYVREPGSSKVGESIRDILLSSKDSISPETEVLLFSAARAQLVHDVIKPHLNNERSAVVCDRYYYSTIAYQGAGRNLSLRDLEFVSSFSIQGVEPDYVFFLDMPPDVALERLKRLRRNKSLDRYEAESLQFFQNIYNEYHKMSRSNPSFCRVDAVQTQDAMHSDIVKALKLNKSLS